MKFASVECKAHTFLNMKVFFVGILIKKPHSFGFFRNNGVLTKTKEEKNPQKVSNVFHGPQHSRGKCPNYCLTPEVKTQCGI